MGEQNKMPGFWTTEQLATAADVSSAYLRRLLKAGKLRGSKVAKTWFIPDEEAERWLAQRSQTKDSTPG